jgi:hypothetical protein
VVAAAAIGIVAALIAAISLVDSVPSTELASDSESRRDNLKRAIGRAAQPEPDAGSSLIDLADLIPRDDPEDLRELALTELRRVQSRLRGLLSREDLRRVERDFLQLCVEGWVRRSRRYGKFLTEELPRYSLAGTDHRPARRKLLDTEEAQIRRDGETFLEEHAVTSSPHVRTALIDLLVNRPTSTPAKAD